MNEISAQEYEDARVLIHGQGIDLIFCLTMWTLFNKTNVAQFGPIISGLERPAARMFLSQTLLTLCKAAETYQRYKYLLPQDGASEGNK